MGVYLRGNGVSLVQTFESVDPLTGATTAADPTTVTFTVRAPDDAETAYVYGVDANVTRAQMGIYVCQLAPPLPPGDYVYAIEGTGALVARGEGTFTILESGVLPPLDSTVADYGPCQRWVDGGDVADFDPALGVGSETWRLDDFAAAGSQLAYEISARQFPGICQRKVRPCRQTCSCFGSSVASGLGPWIWPSSVSGSWWGGWTWRNECGDACGCGSESYIELDGYPVRRVLQVKVDGSVLVEGVDYRLDGRRRVIRLPDATTTPPTDRFWPACQDLSLDDSQAGTYSVLYEWGAEPPELGKLAACQLAAEFFRAVPANKGECRLPTKVTRIVRNGVTMEKVVPIADLIREGATGLPLVDAFVSLVNPQKARLRSLVWSPDRQPYGRTVGQ